jgi:uncharacterized membrane protein
MKEWLEAVIEYSVTTINLMVVVIIGGATLMAFFRCLRALWATGDMGPQLRDAYLRYGRWLIAGLTFQLAADIIETSLAPNWEEIGRLGAIAVIRTFLSYFLDRDMKEMRERQESGKQE